MSTKLQRWILFLKIYPAELRTRIIDCLETAHTRLQLLSKDNSVETIELKRGSNSVYVQYDDIMFLNHQQNLTDSLPI